MLVVRDHLVRHPDRCTHQALCVPICPTGAWLSTPLQVRSIAMSGKLPTLPGRLSIASDLCRFQKRRQTVGAAEEVRSEVLWLITGAR